MMFVDTIENLKVELIEIMDRIEGSVKTDKGITESQKVDALIARDYIYLGFKKLLECV